MNNESSLTGRLHFTGDPDSARRMDFLTRVRELLGFPNQVQLELVSIQSGPSGGRQVDYSATLPIQLSGSEYGIADGVTVEEATTAQLSFDAAGKLVSFHYEPFDEHHLQLVRNQIIRLAATDAIAAERSKAGPSGKPWYLERDAHGIRRLKRAHMP